MLHIDVHGRRRNSRVVLVHGFTQTARSWTGVADGLAEHHQVVCVDAPGHGFSDHIRVDLWQGARLLGEAGGQAAYVGYSMGGRLALHLAVAAPYLVRRLVLVGATAGIDDLADRAARRTSDEELAADLERHGIEAFLERWLASPLFATLPKEAAGREDRARNSAAGLAASLRLMGTGAQEPLWDRLGHLTMPVLVVVGELDAKFRDLGERLVQTIGPNASMAVIPDAGHAVHLERPSAFVAAIAPFLTGEAGHEMAMPTESSAP